MSPPTRAGGSAPLSMLPPLASTTPKRRLADWLTSLKRRRYRGSKIWSGTLSVGSFTLLSVIRGRRNPAPSAASAPLGRCWARYASAHLPTASFPLMLLLNSDAAGCSLARVVETARLLICGGTGGRGSGRCGWAPSRSRSAAFATAARRLGRLGCCRVAKEAARHSTPA